MGGQSNKDSTGYTFSEEEREIRFIKLRGKKFSELTKNLHKWIWLELNYLI